MLWLTGMSALDSAVHAMASVATGGFSTRDASVGAFNDPTAEWIMIVTMIIGGSPLLLLYQFVHGNPRPLLRNGPVQAFCMPLLTAATMLAYLLAYNHGMMFTEAFRVALFNVVSIVTTTGFATADYTLWGHFSVAVFFFLMFMGGCTGSTSGGIKIFRMQILLEAAR